ncbi:MAG: thioredoxin family protein [Polyangiales bacterium]
MTRFGLVLSLVLASCASAPKPPPKAPITGTKGFDFIEDDFGRALATAKAAHKPLFVDVWAPWCHTCLSLRAYVFRDPAMARVQGEFVWAAIDTENAKNASFVEKYPIEAWPTLFVIDSQTGAPIVTWLGAANTTELLAILDDARAGKGPATAHWIAGNRAAAEGKRAEAIAAYKLAASEETDPARRARIVDAWVHELGKTSPAECVEVAKAELPKLPKGTSRGNVAITGLECAEAVKGDASPFVAAIEAIVGDPSDPILADDRSALYEGLVEHDHGIGDKIRAKEHARAWATFLETEAGKAKDPDARQVFDSHRMLAYLELGEGEKAVPMLLASEKDFPEDYNPPSRLAKVYMVLGRNAEAQAAIDRALAKAYGPRRLRLWSLAADIAKARNDLAGEKAALDKGIAEAKAMPNANQKLLQHLEERRSKL